MFLFLFCVCVFFSLELFFFDELTDMSIVYSVIMRKGEKLVECYAPGEAVGQTAYCMEGEKKERKKKKKKKQKKKKTKNKKKKEQKSASVYGSSCFCFAASIVSLLAERIDYETPLQKSYMHQGYSFNYLVNEDGLCFMVREKKD